MEFQLPNRSPLGADKDASCHCGCITNLVPSGKNRPLLFLPSRFCFGRVRRRPQDLPSRSSKCKMSGLGKPSWTGCDHIRWNAFSDRSPRNVFSTLPTVLILLAAESPTKTPRQYRSMEKPSYLGKATTSRTYKPVRLRC